MFRPLLRCAVLAALPVASAAAGPHRLASLDSGWRLQSSAVAKSRGEAISKAGFETAGWHEVSVPNTVAGALVEIGHFKDPFFGKNLRDIPGTTYPIGERFTLLTMPKDSPFYPTWWYRKEFDLPAKLGRHVALHLDGINYRANVWLNGTLVASDKDVVGAFRRWELDVTSLVRPGGRNVVAVEVRAPEPHDLAFMWVDWNPTPADKNMGLWGEVYLTESGPVTLRYPTVTSDLDLASFSTARLTVRAELRNTTDKAVKGVLKGTIEAVRFAKPFELTPGAAQSIVVTPKEAPGLVLSNPRVWWPYRMGEQHLYPLEIEVEVDGAVSDKQKSRFGIQQMSTELTPQGGRLFKVNGRNVLIRGGGWASDMFFRPASRERLSAELRYVKEMGLNTIRLEGKLESDLFYDLADEQGILLMPGWCCCDQWELWDKWDAEDRKVAPASLTDQILRLRSHPSIVAWFNASDFPPPADVERTYLDVLERLGFSKPVVSNATDKPGPVSGPSGVKMRGPYDYVPPSYWLTDTKNGGAFGFATEVGPGAAVPPLDSLKQMLPPEHLWPIDDFWNFHAGGDEFRDIRRFTAALEARYGKATGVEDFARKAQAMTYDGQRAMFEAYGRNKYVATGVIQWMLNNAWPSMIWHLYDYYLRPGGGYYGSKKALEPVHVQFSYDDRTVAVVNDRPTAFQGLQVSASVFDTNLKPLFEKTATLDVAADGVARAFAIPAVKAPPGVYFVRLGLDDAAGKPLSSNFYWLSTREDELDWAGTQWFFTPTKTHADLTGLSRLPATTLSISAQLEADPAKPHGVVTVANIGKSLAFQVHVKLIDPKSGREAVPVYWDDNYFALMPGEKRELRVAYAAGTPIAGFAAEASAWNAPRITAEVAR